MPIDRPAVWFVTAFLSLTLTSFAAADTPAANIPETYILDGKALSEARHRAQQADPALAEGIQEIRNRADRHMNGKLWTVINKPFAGPSGDKHDYVSLASYFWPDPATSTGLPYVSRDGELNPETREYDRTRLEGMSDAVYFPAIAYYITGEERYAERAAAQVRAWFLDEETRMNPHLTNAQMIKGKNEGSSFGLIETERLVRVVDAVALLQDSKAWTAEDDKKLRQWFAEYLKWLQTSELGKREARAPNNHGTLYDVQTTVFALFTGQEHLAKEIIENVKSRRIATQIEPDGAQPAELKRTKSWSYSLLNLTGMVHLAHLGERLGVDLWNYETPDGRSIRKVLDYMFPYVTWKAWDRQQITRQSNVSLVYILRHAADAYKEPKYEEAIAGLQGVEREVVWIDLLYPAKE